MRFQLYVETKKSSKLISYYWPMTFCHFSGNTCIPSLKNDVYLDVIKSSMLCGNIDRLWCTVIIRRNRNMWDLEVENRLDGIIYLNEVP